MKEVEKNMIQVKLGRTTYLVEARNAEKSRVSADSVFKKMVADAASQL